MNQLSFRSVFSAFTNSLGLLGSRWVTNNKGVAANISAQSDRGDSFLESDVFSKNLSRLAEFVTAAKNADKVQ